MLDAIAQHLEDGDPELAYERAIGLFTLLVGSLQLARAITDRELSERVLTAAYADAVLIAGGPRTSAGNAQQESR